MPPGPGRLLGAWSAGVLYGTGFGLLTLLLRPVLPGLFAAAPGVRSLLLAVLLLVVAAQQPVAGVVFVLDGVLVGVGDQNYLAVAGVIALAVFLPAAALVLVLHGGLVAPGWPIPRPATGWIPR